MQSGETITPEVLVGVGRQAFPSSNLSLCEKNRKENHPVSVVFPRQSLICEIIYPVLVSA